MGGPGKRKSGEAGGKKWMWKSGVILFLLKYIKQTSNFFISCRIMTQLNPDPFTKLARQKEHSVAELEPWSFLFEMI